MSYEEVKKGVVKKTSKREIALFIDGTGLDRATKRLNRKVELSKLVKGLSNGLKPTIARYYTMVPFEDDSRHRAYLDAMDKAGLEVVVKRLPPKGVTRQVNVYCEMASDMVAYALGHKQFSSLSRHIPTSEQRETKDQQIAKESKKTVELSPINDNVTRSVTVVCPAWELEYPILLVKEFGVDTISADFGEFTGRNVLKNAAKWIDLSDSETIWRE